MRSLYISAVVAGLLAIAIALPAAAQTHYETRGRVQQGDPLDGGEDGFRPVWQQQQREQSRQQESGAALKERGKTQRKARSTNPPQGNPGQ